MFDLVISVESIRIIFGGASRIFAFTGKLTWREQEKTNPFLKLCQTSFNGSSGKAKQFL